MKQVLFLASLLSVLTGSFALGSAPPGWKAGPAISYSKPIGPWTTDMYFSDDGNFLAFLGASGDIGIVKTADQNIYYPDPEQMNSSYLSHISFMPNSHFLFIGGASDLGYLNIDNREISSLPISNADDTLQLLGGPDFHHFIGGIVTNPRVGAFLTLDKFSQPVLWKSFSLAPAKILPILNVSKAAYDATGKFLITDTPTLSVIDLERNLVINELIPHSPIASINNIEVSGNCVAVAHDFGVFPTDKAPAVEVVDFISGQSILHLEFEGAQAGEKEKIISLDGFCQTMLVTDMSQSKLVDITSGKVIATFSEHLSDSDQELNEKNHISASVISKDGKTVAIGYRTVMIFKRM